MAYQTMTCRARKAIKGASNAKGGICRGILEFNGAELAGDQVDQGGNAGDREGSADDGCASATDNGAGDQADGDDVFYDHGRLPDGD